MSSFGFAEREIVPFFASLMRVGGLFLVTPFFGDNNIPPVVKLLLSFTINLVVFPIAVSQGFAYVDSAAQTDVGIIVLALKEGAVGLVLEIGRAHV